MRNLPVCINNAIRGSGTVAIPPTNFLVNGRQIMIYLCSDCPSPLNISPFKIHAGKV